MRRIRSAVTVIASLALLSACNQPAEAPPTPPVEPTPAPATSTTPPVSYACESGQSIAVSYPDAATAVLTYKGQSASLRTVASATGARFSGSGLEWWTATQDGQETATLSRLGPNEDVGVAVLERCSRPSSGPVAPGPTPTPQPAPGGVLPAATPCKGPQLKLLAAGGDAGMGNRVAVYGVQNLGAQACSLTGYPTVTLQDRQGRNLSAVRAEQNPGNYFHNNGTPTPVTLAPQGKAFFDVAWNVVPHEGEGETVCPTAARLRMTAPGDSSPVSFTVSFTPCGSRIRVSPFRPVAEDTPPTAAVADTTSL